MVGLTGLKTYHGDISSRRKAMMMALPRPLSNGWTVCRLLLVSVINKGTLPEQDTQIMDNCKTQEVQMNRVLKTMVLFFILTGVSWQAAAFSDADLKS